LLLLFPQFFAAASQAPVTRNQPAVQAKPAGAISTSAVKTAAKEKKNKGPASECAFTDPISLAATNSCSDLTQALDSLPAQGPRLRDTILQLRHSPIPANKAASTTPLLSVTAPISTAASVTSYFPGLVSHPLDFSQDVRTVQSLVLSSHPLRLRAAAAAPTTASAAGKVGCFRRKLLGAVKALAALTAASSIADFMLVSCCC
jgi:hypothetical protein